MLNSVMPYQKPLRIGPLEFDSPFILAPLAGYTDLPFRLLCRRYGAGYCVSEMISCHGLVYKQSNTLKMLDSNKEERPVSFQLFGADPDIMVEAAVILASYAPDMIDINMGCPVKKVTKRGAGAALMSTPDISEKIISGITKAISLPVTVKIRSGKDQNNINAVEFAKMVEGSGAAAITVHARTWAQGFSGRITPGVIKNVKEALTIPVIGNGDVLSKGQGKQLFEQTRCDGVMIGRGALGNPWVFSDTGRPKSLQAIADGALEHLSLIERYLPAERVMGYVRNQTSRYFKGLPGCSRIRKELFETPTLSDLKMVLDSIAHRHLRLSAQDTD